MWPGKTSRMPHSPSSMRLANSKWSVFSSFLLFSAVFLFLVVRHCLTPPFLTQCVNTDPIAPQLSGPEDEAFSNLTLSNRVVLSWVPLSYLDFGVVCSYTGVNMGASYSVYYGNTAENMTLFDRFLYTDNQTTNIANLLTSGQTYYWKVVVSVFFLSLPCLISPPSFSTTEWKIGASTRHPTDSPRHHLWCTHFQFGKQIPTSQTSQLSLERTKPLEASHLGRLGPLLVASWAHW